MTGPKSRSAARTIGLAVGGVMALALVGLAAASDWSRPKNLAPRAELRLLQGKDAPPTFAAKEDLRIDGTAEEFGESLEISIGPGGIIAVQDWVAAHVHLYRPDGSRIVTIGRHGDGPGEFRGLNEVGWVGATMWTWDTRQNRLTFWDSTGKYQDDIDLHYAVAGPAHIARIPFIVRNLNVHAVPADDEFIVSGRPIRLNGGFDWDPRTLYVTIGSTGLVKRIVADYTRSEDAMLHYSTHNFGWTMGTPFIVEQLFTISKLGDRMAHVSTVFPSDSVGTVSVSVFSSRGDTIVRRAFPFDAIKIPQRVIDSTLEATLAWMGKARGYDQGSLNYVAAALPEKMKHPYAPVTMLMLGRDSTIWLGLRPTETTRTLLMLDALGEPIATITIPRRLSIVAAERSAIWGLVRNDDDVVSVVRYAVRSGPGT